MKAINWLVRMILILFAGVSMAAQDTKPVWKEVEKALGEGLPRTAIEKLQTIQGLARQAGRPGEWLKALSEQFSLEAAIEGGTPETKIIRLEAELAKAPVEVQPLVRTLLAIWYEEYLDRNRWRFMQRTRSGQAAGAGLTTWDLRRIFEEIDQLYQSVLTGDGAKVIRQVPVERYLDFLEGGTTPAAWRPTLYDIAAFRALEFYSQGEWNALQPEDAFEIDAESPALAGRTAFLGWQPETTDTGSPRLRVIRIAQDLLRFHESNNRPMALLDADRHRVRLIQELAFGERKTSLARQQLESLAKEKPALEVTGLILADLAEAWRQEGDLARAHAIARDGAARFPETLGGQACLAVLKEIEQKQLQLQTEYSVPPGPAALRIGYANVTRLFFRIYPENPGRLLYQAGADSDDLDEAALKTMLMKTALHAWDVELPATPDFKIRQQELMLPALPAGRYRIVASDRPKFLQAAMVTQAGLWVSRMTCVMRPGAETDGFVMDAVSGEPLAGVNFTLYNQNERKYQETAKGVTDANGYFHYPVPSSGWRRQLLLEQNGERLLVPATGYWGGGGRLRGSSARDRDMTLFFTDRAIYRPGHSIHFKGICIRPGQESGRYDVLPDCPVLVRFFDVNHQEIERLELQTNRFGSFSGNFTAPAGRLLGQMSLVTEKPAGSVSFRVEEYKRPTFQVELDPLKQAARLQEKVVVSGRATNYTGAPVDGALLRFRVQRRARFPHWWSWYRSFTPSPPQEIAHGTARTGAGGEFSISFTARPDPAIKPDSDPVFIYQIFADVTGNAGETRSASLPVAVGYKSMELFCGTEGRLEEGTPFAITVAARNLNGQPLPARGSWRLQRLQEPVRPVRKSMWQMEFEPDAGLSEGFARPWVEWPAAGIAAEGQFDTPDGEPARLPLELRAGLYRLEVSGRDESGAGVTGRLPLMVLPGWEGTVCPLRLPSVQADRGRMVKAGDTFESVWGTGYATGRCIVEVLHRGGTVERSWSSSGNTLHRLRIKVDEKYRGGFSVRYTYVRENRHYVHDVMVDVPWDNKQLAITTETFRPVLEPGETSLIRLKVKGEEAGLKAAEMVAALYDASLDQFVAHAWHPFNFFYRDHSLTPVTFANHAKTFQAWKMDWNPAVSAPEISYLHFPVTGQYWGVHAYAFNGRRKGEMRAAPMAAAPSPSPMVRESTGAAQPEAEPAVALQAADQGGGPPVPEAGEAAPATAAAPLKIRQNLNETAFFFPHLLMEKDGSVTMQFTMPEALTQWKFQGLAHSADCRNGLLTGSLITRKELMVQPNPPRFLREGDEICFSAKVVNMAETEQSGTVTLELEDLLTGAPAAERLQLDKPDHPFRLAPRESAGFDWRLKIPAGAGPVRFVVMARSERHADGEEGVVPVLPGRILVTEAATLPLRGPVTRQFNLERLREVGRPGSTLEPSRLTVEMSSRPVWYAVQALPFLVEFPYECAEQVFNRYYANLLAGRVANAHPRIRQVFEQWKNSAALQSNLEKNQDLKAVLLEESPWVRDGQDESRAKRNVGLLFDENILRANLQSALEKLRQLQQSDGSWSWFPGGPSDDYITLYILAGFGRLRQAGAPGEFDIAQKAAGYADEWLRQSFERIPEKERGENHLNPLVAQYLYGRSFFLAEQPVPEEAQPALDYFLKQARRFWLGLDNRLNQGQLALSLARWGDRETPGRIVASLRERAVHDPETGMSWRDDGPSWWWYRAPIETQAVMIEVFDEVAQDQAAVEELQIWLLKQKQTRDWKTTKATADAVYALILKGDPGLERTALVEVSMGGQPVEPGPAEAGTGYFKKQYFGGDIKPAAAEITVVKRDAGIAWGAVYFQYFEELAKVTGHDSGLQLEKTILVKRDSKAGPVLEPVAGPLAPGDRLTVRLVLRTGRDLEYVHLKDGRGSGLEPADVLSGWRYQDGLGYYQMTRDTASHFFIGYLPRGTYVFEYDLRVQLRGRYQAGLAEIQCMYAPEFAGHSASTWLKVE